MEPLLMNLPDGLTCRPLAQSDARAVYEVMAAQELYDVGEVPQRGDVTSCLVNFFSGVRASL